MFKRVGIIGFVDNPLVKETVARLTKYFEENKIEYLVEESTLSLSDLPPNGHSCNRSELGSSCSLIMVVGGDGSMLHAARDLVDFNVPLLGINRGRLGFLTDILPSDMEEQISDVMAGNYVTSERFLIECDLVRDGEIVDQGIALDDDLCRETGFGVAGLLVDKGIHAPVQCVGSDQQLPEFRCLGEPGQGVEHLGDLGGYGIP